MIRQATLDNIPRLIELGRVMHAESARFAALSFDAVKLEQTLEAAIKNHFAMVSEVDGVVVGGLLAVVSPHWFSQDLYTCDIALFIDPQYRGGVTAVRLLKAYAAWAKDVGSKMTLFGIMTGVNTEQTVKLCQALGWRQAGVVMEI
jgi:GNAT superfamily N-acetyltransferase